MAVCDNSCASGRADAGPAPLVEQFAGQTPAIERPAAFLGRPVNSGR
jgi:hypothetical protein